MREHLRGRSDQIDASRNFAAAAAAKNVHAARELADVSRQLLRGSRIVFEEDVCIRPFEIESGFKGDLIDPRIQAEPLWDSIAGARLIALTVLLRKVGAVRRSSRVRSEDPDRVPPRKGGDVLRGVRLVLIIVVGSRRLQAQGVIVKDEIVDIRYGIKWSYMIYIS